MERRIQRIILDLEDLMDERYIDSDSKQDIEEVIEKLKRVRIYSTEV